MKNSKKLDKLDKMDKIMKAVSQSDYLLNELYERINFPETSAVIVSVSENSQTGTVTHYGCEYHIKMDFRCYGETESLRVLIDDDYVYYSDCADKEKEIIDCFVDKLREVYGSIYDKRYFDMSLSIGEKVIDIIDLPDHKNTYKVAIESDNKYDKIRYVTKAFKRSSLGGQTCYCVTGLNLMHISGYYECYFKHVGNIEK